MSDSNQGETASDPNRGETASDPNRGEFVQFVLDHGEETVRGAFRYDDETTELLYLRDDVDPALFRRRTVFATRQALHKYRHGGGVDAIGGSDAHVELFDGVAAFHLRTGSTAGVVVAIDMPAIADLNVFVDRCRNVLHGAGNGHPPTVAGD